MTRSKLHSVILLITAGMVLFAVLVQPNHPQAMTWGALAVFPLELPVILLALMALGNSRVSFAVRVVITFVLTLIVALKTADFVSFSALSRGFNPIADLPLVGALTRFVAGTFGPVSALAAVVVAVSILILVGWLIWWATGTWARLAVPTRMARLSAVAAGCAALMTTAQIGQAMGSWSLAVDPPGSAFTARVGVERIEMVRTTLSALRTFREAAMRDPFTGGATLLDVIDRDVIVLFVESYGRTSLDTPFYAATHRATLADYQAQLFERGLSMRSGYLTAPTRGGQSWLSHATFANGLWVDNQIRYAAALSSGRQTLFHHAANSGFHTAAVMPQITLDWPESASMGFETVLASDDLGYRGPSFNWVTMPDQFTLAALDRLLRSGDDERQLFAQVALVSSHAPWVPVPEILDWGEIGDGTVYDEIAASGDRPETVWQDHDRVRTQYRLAVDYALRTVFEYAKLHADDPPLMIVIGDHQAAEFIALDTRPHVPMHVIGPHHLVENLADVAPWIGLLPGSDVQAVAMDRMRDVILAAYSTVTTRNPVY